MGKLKFNQIIKKAGYIQTSPVFGEKETNFKKIEKLGYNLMLI